MRLWEILKESEQQNLEKELTDFLVASKANNVLEIPTKKLVQSLNGAGFSVDANVLMPLLSRNKMVLNATPKFIRLVGSEGGEGEGKTSTSNNSAEIVADMARSAVKF